MKTELKRSYDFDEIIERRHTNALNTDGFRSYIFHAGPEKKFPYKDEEFVRMWVADMEFATPPEICEAMKKRIDKRIFGYSMVFDSDYYNVLQKWCREKYDWEFPRKELCFSSGIIPALYELTEDLLSKNEKMMIVTPAYGYFKHTAEYNNVELVCSNLKNDGGEFTIDFDDFEKKASDPHMKLILWCNPHNPTGRMWTAQELTKVAKIVEKYNLWIISDEIHCDLTKPGTEYIPFASVDDTCRDISVTCIAPTKTFNLAGLQTAAVYAENSILHHRMWRQLNTDEVAEPNAFAIQATIAAFQYGEEWLDELREYVEKNKQYVTEFLQEKIPLIHPVAGDATYLMWLDCRKITESGRQFVKFIRKTSGLYVSGGNQYGRGGEGFLRVNVATSKLVVEDGMQRLYESVDAWLKEEKISK